MAPGRPLEGREARDDVAAARARIVDDDVVGRVGERGAAKDLAEGAGREHRAPGGRPVEGDGEELRRGMGDQSAVLLGGDGLAPVRTERDHVVRQLRRGTEREANREHRGEYGETTRGRGEKGGSRALVVAAKPESVVEGAEAEGQRFCAGLLYGPEFGAPLGQPAVAFAGWNDPGREVKERAGHDFSMGASFASSG